MKFFHSLLRIAVLLLICISAAVAGETRVLAWSEVKARDDLRAELASNGRDQFTITISNRSTAPAVIEIPAGLICGGGDGSSRVIGLRSARLEVAASGSAEAILPAAALTLATAATAQAFVATDQKEPKLAELLKYLATRPDVPRATSQLVVLSLLEDVSFSQWQAFLAASTKIDPGTPSPGEIVQAIDGLAILREIAPAKTLALAKDSELKLRALRNPWTRAKAMQLYGIALSSDEAATALAPEIGQLPHRVPGDNCPICRGRARMQQPSDF